MYRCLAQPVQCSQLRLLLWAPMDFSMYPLLACSWALLLIVTWSNGRSSQEKARSIPQSSQMKSIPVVTTWEGSVSCSSCCCWSLLGLFGSMLPGIHSWCSISLWVGFRWQSCYPSSFRFWIAIWFFNWGQGYLMAIALWWVSLLILTTNLGGIREPFCFPHPPYSPDPFTSGRYSATYDPSSTAAVTSQVLS